MPIPRSHWESRPPWHKLPVWIAYSVVRLLMGLFGYGGRAELTQADPL